MSNSSENNIDFESTAKLARAIIHLGSFSVHELAEISACEVRQVEQFVQAHSEMFDPVGGADEELLDGRTDVVWRLRDDELSKLKRLADATGQRRLDLRGRIEMALAALSRKSRPLEGILRERELQIAHRYLLAAETQVWDRQATAMSVSLSDQLEMLSLRKRLNSLHGDTGALSVAPPLLDVEQALYDAVRDWVREMPTSEDAHRCVHEDLREDEIRAGDYGILRGIPASRQDDLAANLRPALRALALERHSRVVEGGSLRVKQDVLNACRHVLKLPQPALCVAPIAVLAAAWNAAELAQPILQVLLDGDVDQYLSPAGRRLCLSALGRLAARGEDANARRSAATAGFYLATAAAPGSPDLALLGPAALLAGNASRFSLVVRFAQEFFDSRHSRAIFLESADEAITMRNLVWALFSSGDPDDVGRELDAALLAHPSVETLIANVTRREFKASVIGDASDSRDLFVEPDFRLVRFTSLGRIPILRPAPKHSHADLKMAKLRQRFQDLLTSRIWEDQRSPYNRESRVTSAASLSEKVVEGIDALEASPDFRAWLSQRAVDPAYTRLAEEEAV